MTTMDFYTVVLRQSGRYWLALCLENSIDSTAIGLNRDRTLWSHEELHIAKDRLSVPSRHKHIAALP